ncbi:DUF3892 domain-containing protein [Guptibacillus hwajinpoensis]|uniref:DUF3892 domain-containing protein n=1 Tax=Guptibacillus hwajinpoensis TaxID=208199 RepID=UPI0037370ECA
MSNKWADYLISAVRYHNNEDYIEELAVHVDNGESVGASSSWSRQKVVSSINKGSTFFTIYKQNTQWTKGAKVEVRIIDSENYLRTDSNRIKKDNLGQLPKY